MAFTWNGLRALGRDEARSRRFPRNFGRAWPPVPRFWATRAPIIPITGPVGLTARTCTRSCILFARDEAERQRTTREHQAYLARTPGVQVLSALDFGRCRRSPMRATILAIATG